MNYMQQLSGKNFFSRQELYRAAQIGGFVGGEETFKKEMQRMLLNGNIARVGRNKYCVPPKDVNYYNYSYSELSHSAARLIGEKHPYLDFTLFELIQLNEFVNHQIAHNIVFVSVENDIVDFVFDTLKEAYPGKVLINPTEEIFHQYWSDDMIVIVKLVTESPFGRKEKWHTRLEKLLVDLFAEPLLLASVSEGEYTRIYEEAFASYIIDESCLFRYARRRSVESRIKKFIDENTTVQLRTRIRK